MFKKTLQVVTTFGLLLAAYAGYVRIFAIVAAGLGPVAQATQPWVRKESTTQQEATRTAAEAFGPNHWSADKALPVRYYNHERGYWMYAREYDRVNDGKQLRFRPFSVVWKSQDGRALKTATSDEAIVDLDQPLGVVNKAGSPPMKVTHARLEGNVQLRDDKGTRESTIDDLVIGPMPYVEFDEPSLQIRSASDIVIQDRDMRITGFDLLIQLRPKDDAAPSSMAGGFDAKTAFIKKNVHIIINDVGSSGILPGKAEPGPAPQAGQVREERTPLDLRCVGEMRVELPQPKKAPLVGPPAPPLPTMIYFARDVVVRRGRPGQTPDQLDCDALRLTMLPKPKTAPKPTAPSPDGGPANEPATAEPAAPAATGAGTEMALHEALATGHTVWLQSKGQGITARCNELIHKKLAPDRADETYLRGDPKSKLWVEKIETVADGPDKGKPKSVTTIRTIDATIFEDGQGSENATIVARGPGLLETRPSRDKPVERKAIWQDHLVMKSDFDPQNQPMKLVTLTGRPEFIDVAQASLDAEKEIVVWLTPKRKPAAPTESGTPPSTSSSSGPDGTSDSFQIKHLKALGNVHLIAPGKVMNARDVLMTDFDTTPVLKDIDRNGKPGSPAPDPSAAEKAKAAAPAPTPAAPDAPVPPGEKAGPEATPASKPKAEPEVTITADRVWALIRMKPETDPAQPKGEAGMSGGQVQEVRLRGGVVFHQDPAADKTQGTDVTGQALDVVNQGDGKMKFLVQNHVDSKSATAAELALTPHARVVTEEMTITGPKIGLDQAEDHAWVEGPGTLTQLAPRGLLTDKGHEEASRVAVAKDSAKGKGKGQEATDDNKRPLTISWQSQMKFVGRPENVTLGGKPVALAQFFHGVRAVMEDTQLSCQDHLDVYMDRFVSLARPKGDAGDKAPGEDRPQISLLDCFKNVVVDSRKLDPNTKVLLQRQRIEGEQVRYDKLTGNFWVPGKGKVTLWNREGNSDNPLSAPSSGSGPASGTRTIRPTANPAAPPPARRATAVVGSNGSQIAPGRVGAAAAAAGGRGPALPPLKLTLINFDNEMTGRYVAGKDTDTTEPRSARFIGDVQVIHAQVPHENTQVNFDRPPEGYVLLSAQTMDVISTPTPGQSSAARNYLHAVTDAQAKTRSETIKADVITYDSQKDLFYAYAENGRAVAIVKQESVGQPISTSRQQAIKYNRRTGESEMINPMSAIEFVDAKSGIRPGPAGETKDKMVKTPRIGPALRIPVRSQTERKGMTGR